MWKEIKRIFVLIIIVAINITTMYFSAKILQKDDKVPMLVLNLIYCFSCYALGRYEERYLGGKKC